MGVAIRTAGEGDREQVVRLLDSAFRDDPVSNWIFPGEALPRAHHRLMGAFTDMVMADGRIDLLEDGTGCALWLPVPGKGQEGGHEEGHGEGPEEDGGGDDAVRLREAVDPGNPRVEQIARLTSGIHPEDRAHEYLWMIGVAPERQGEGLGALLIGAVLDRCDRDGMPAYLEASSARSRGLYERLGFEVLGAPLELPDGGPTMWPMWREPHPS
ncbi:GNAT family N-acetyltransferase [Streptomyces sp. NPDC093252]|uniref:GNAT family N-acetyltransferase n=1 Tax=Streptomyces sp. NPDC093252 TaxID=3154980 RepID=UPI0034377C2E